MFKSHHRSSLVFTTFVERDKIPVLFHHLLLTDSLDSSAVSFYSSFFPGCPRFLLQVSSSPVPHPTMTSLSTSNGNRTSAAMPKQIPAGLYRNTVQSSFLSFQRLKYCEIWSDIHKTVQMHILRTKVTVLKLQVFIPKCKGWALWENVSIFSSAWGNQTCRITTASRLKFSRKIAWSKFLTSKLQCRWLTRALRCTLLHFS